MNEPDEPRPRSGRAARNERRKALATTLNALSVAGLIAAGVQPVVAGRFEPVQAGVAVFAFVVAQALLYYILGRMED